MQKKSNTPEANAKKSHKGENHPKWIADRSKLASPRSMAEFKWWRSEVFKRDNYTCVECGEYGGVLQAHHKAPVCVFPKYKFEIWNGITVCKPCHNEIHRAANELFKTGGYFNRLKEKQIAF
jgi:rubrerythrin